MTTTISAAVTKDQLISALRSLTIARESFDGGAWSLDDAETLEMIAASVREAVAIAAERDQKNFAHLKEYQDFCRRGKRSRPML
jgi:hypothetical protein